MRGFEQQTVCLAGGSGFYRGQMNIIEQNLHELHAKRRQLLNDIRGAEQARQYELAKHLLVEFQEINQCVRDADELVYKAAI